MIVSLVGSDGAGKSTVSRLATERLFAAGTRAERVDRWDIIDNADYPATLFMRPDVLNTRICVAEMPSTSRFLFLMWSVTHALLGRTPEAGRPDKVTLLDGYWMKHAAGEIVYGLDSAWVEGVVSGLPRSEQVIYLRLDPHLAWERKVGRDVVPYECGMDPECSRDSFLTHQSRILGVLDDWAEQFGWLTVDAGEPLDEVVGRVVSTVSALSTTEQR
ncbi:thymidylate kinase [Streptomyces sp. L-9-10]|uniref:thymidylate kinase n=1 Tax=Streptomyces sp. L-9-10 TaxID=1478131 RepID=UPI00101CC1BA|nr:thymidylate kinase [Streptomyces sp. L-9-10]RYJ23330.1 thymidylate kinase [Streptomyces sp. L-9-10]